jgi:shikimate dehydrogenase
MHNTGLSFHGIDASYHAVSVSLSELSVLYAHLNSVYFLGANVTIPHKEQIIEAVDELTNEAETIRAVNTIIKKEDGSLLGHNTDAFGFTVPLEPFLDELPMDRAIVFGSGGATKAILYALKKMGYMEIIMVSRRPERYQETDNVIICSYDEWTHYAGEADLIVNATPLGMTPNTASSPVSDDSVELIADSVWYDIVYNPRETTFIKQGKSVGCRTIGGLEMLVHQGAESFRIWTGLPFPTELIMNTLDEVYPY